MKGSPCSIKIMLCYDGAVIGVYKTLADLYSNHTPVFKNLNQLKNWSVGRSINQVNRRYSLIKL